MARLGRPSYANRESACTVRSNNSSQSIQGHHSRTHRFPEDFAADSNKPAPAATAQALVAKLRRISASPLPQAGLASSRKSCSPSAFLLALALVTFLYLSCAHLLPRGVSSALALGRDVRRDVVSALPLLDVFQVHQPVLGGPRPSVQLLSIARGHGDDAVATAGNGANACHQVLMEYSFALSYGQPFVGPYHPPVSCDFNRVTFNLTVLSAGRQFDRLGLVYFGDTEIFRTSTAEPTPGGIRWTYEKDMTSYLSLFKTSQKLIFDLGNLIDETYTAPFNVTLSASFFTSADDFAPADAILPLSAKLSASNRPSAFSLPSSDAITNVTFPRNVRRAVATISACGQADEEFWFGNVPSSATDTFAEAPGAPLFGFSPFREVQLFIDGNLAGVAWPFPIIFTGGVVPGLWRPIVGIDAFDLREGQIDITPWLPVLCDGATAGHTFEIRVVGIDDNGKGHATLSRNVGNSWIVTGKVFLWLDEADSITKGTKPVLSGTAEPMLSVSSTVRQNSSGSNESLSYAIAAYRHLVINSTILTSAGSQMASWEQTLDYANNGQLVEQGNVQLISQQTAGSHLSGTGYAATYRFPITCNTTFGMDADTGAFSIDASINRGLYFYDYGQLALSTGLQTVEALASANAALQTFIGTALQTSQNGSGHYVASPVPGGSMSSGSTEQDFVFGGIQASPGHDGSSPLSGSYELYRRHVLAVNGSVVRDEESWLGNPSGNPALPAPLTTQSDQTFVASSVKAMLGRGPGALPANLVSGAGT